MPVDEDRILRLVRTLESNDLRNLLDASDRVLSNRHPGSTGFQLGSVSLVLGSDRATTAIEKVVVPWEFVENLKHALKNVLTQSPPASDGSSI